MTTTPSSSAALSASATSKRDPSEGASGLERPVTMRSIARFVRDGTPFACLTAYDATTARWLERAGVPVLLVGDTAAEMILGMPSTVHAPLDFLVTITAAVKRGAPKAFVIGDMPFLSYQADDAEAIRNAGRFLQEGTADAVKLELDRSFAPLVAKMSRAGIPVIAHVGSRPQHAALHGGYYAAGRTADDARALMTDARELVDAGACMLLVEAAPAEVTEAIVEASPVPVIGCGAGPACHGQIVVTHDLLGLTDWQAPFAQPLVQLGDGLLDMARQWRDRVARRDLGEHPYRMRDGESVPTATPPDAS